MIVFLENPNNNACTRQDKKSHNCSSISCKGQQYLMQCSKVVKKVGSREQKKAEHLAWQQEKAQLNGILTMHAPLQNLTIGQCNINLKYCHQKIAV